MVLVLQKHDARSTITQHIVSVAVSFVWVLA